MDWKRFVLGLGAVLLCTSLVAFGAGPSSLTASAPAAKSLSPSTTAASPYVASQPQAKVEFEQKEPMNQARPRGEAIEIAPTAVSVNISLRGEYRSAPTNDECENAEIVTGPYPVTVCGTNNGATTDCPGVIDREAVWYKVTLPYASNKLEANYCPTSFSLSTYAIGAILYNDCSDCSAYMYGQYEWLNCGGGTSNPQVRWVDLPGPTTVLLPVWLSPTDDFCVEINVSEIVTPANDDCENAEYVSGPYPVMVCGSNEGAAIDCPGGFNQKAVWYEIELPYTVNNMEASFCPSDFSLSPYYLGTVYLNDCSDCSSTANGTYFFKDCGNGTSNAAVRWKELPGPGTVMLPIVLDPANEFCFNVNVTEVAQPANDLCMNAEYVSGPYPTTVNGTNQGATIDCPGVLNWNAVWYEVELPYAINTVETDYCPGEIDMQNDNIGIVYTTDCSCTPGSIVAGYYEWNNCGNYRANPKVWWRDVPGPGSIYIPVFIEDSHEFSIEINVRDGDCVVECPVGGVAESEACGEDTNGGCFMPVPTFEPLTCGETVCGSGWAEGGNRDTDWYEISVTEPTILTFTVEAESTVGIAAGMVETIAPGMVGCDLITGSLLPYAEAVDCEELTLQYYAFPGTYWWFVAPARYDYAPCGEHNSYIATMSCETWMVRGACCDDEAGACTDDVLYVDCAGPKRWTQDTLCEDLSPPCGGCPESMIELEIYTDRYPNETTWEITDHTTGAVLFSGGPYAELYTTYNEYICVGTNACYDVTLYDVAGDGQSWGNGGYAIRFDGVEVYSTLGSSWGGFSIENPNIGVVCELGRCCYEPWPSCVETTLVDCVGTYGGSWAAGKNCTDNPCLNPNTADFEVVAPYTSPQRDTCDDALNRCHPMNQYYDTPEHVYLVTIPYDGVWSFNTCLETAHATWLGLGTSMCGEDIGTSSWTCGQAGEIVDFFPAGDYYADVEGYADCGTYVFDVHEIPVCDVQCPAGATQESEPCGSNSNDGCWGWPDSFEQIAADQTICGKIYANNGTDSDWFTYTANATGAMRWTVRSNFSCQLGLAKMNVPGQASCNAFTGMFEPSAYTSGCTDTSVTFDVTAGGTYYLFIGPEAYSGMPCGTTNDYVATLSKYVLGDLDYDQDVDYADYVLFLAAFGGAVDGNPAYDAECDYDGSGAVGLADYQTWLQGYRDFIGNSFSGPPSAPGTPQPTLGGQGGLKKKSLPAAESAEAVQPTAGDAPKSGAIKKLSR